LRPIENTHQSVEFGQFVVNPLTKTRRNSIDDFGNHVCHFEISTSLQSFVVTAIHTVLTKPHTAINFSTSAPWEQVVEVAVDQSRVDPHYLTVSGASKYVAFDKNMSLYAESSFTRKCPILDAAFDLIQRIYTDFQYDPHATQVDTSAIEAFQIKRGVCQDLTHVAIACLRSLKLPARYVSGYVDTKSLSSKKTHKVAGDVSHAWFSVYDPQFGWVDFDPTNNKLVDESYITLAYGRDYSDVAPLKGKVDTTGNNRLKVNVDLAVMD